MLVPGRSTALSVSSAAQGPSRVSPTTKDSPFFCVPYSISPRKALAWRPLSPFVSWSREKGASRLEGRGKPRCW